MPGEKRSRIWDKFGLAYSASKDKGGRNYQEDGYLCVPDFNAMLPDDGVDKSVPRACFCVFDGHGGDKCMEFCRKHMHKTLAAKFPGCSSTEEALKLTFREVEEKWFEHARTLVAPPKCESSGTTAVVCLIEGDKITCANVGDSRAVLYGDAKADMLELTSDHKPNRDSETTRITGAGGEVRQKTLEKPACLCIKASTKKVGPHRVYPGGLAVARSIGDAGCKLPEMGAVPGTVICEPEIMVQTIGGQHIALVLCSDGVWDGFPESVKMHASLKSAYSEGHEELKMGFKQIKEGKSWNNEHAHYVAREVVGVAIAKGPAGQQDNTTCLAVTFPFHAKDCKKHFNFDEIIDQGLDPKTGKAKKK